MINRFLPAGRWRTRPSRVPGWLAVIFLLGSNHACRSAEGNRLSSIRSVTEAQPGPGRPLFMVRGTVTRVGDSIVLQDQTGGLEALPKEALVVEVGDEVEVTGEAAIRGNTHLLVDASVTTLWHSSAPPPLALLADDAANGEHNEVLVQVEGKLLHTVDDAGVMRLQLEGGHQFFAAELPRTELLNAKQRARVANLPLNSIVRLTGVLFIRPQQYSPTDGSFSLLLRDPEDVEVVKGPPWGTSTHIVELVVALIAAGGLVQFAHVRSVQRQYNAILAERARIGRDVHDTLAQGFAGIALQLEVVRGDMQRNPALAQTHLRTALGMVRHCRAEAHRSISTLRAFSKPMTLDQMLREMIASVTSASSATVQLHLEELRTPPSQQTAEQLFRICQEAVSNAVQHAAPRNIWVSLRESHEDLTLSVRDDGCGFEVSRAGQQPAVHFGIIGMQERAAHLRARLSLDSRPGETMVRVTVSARKTDAPGKRHWFPWRRDPGEGGVQEGLEA